MKQLFRFFTVLLLAAVTSEAWAIDVPKPKTTALQPDVELYILNVGTQLYLGQGEAWGTQAAGAKKGLKYILKNKRDDGEMISFAGPNHDGLDDAGNEITQLPSGQYWLYAPTITGAAGHSTCRWQDGTCGSEYRCSFTDQTDWDERGVWQIASVGNNTYTLQVPQGLSEQYITFQNMYVEGEFAGIWPEHGSTWGQNNLEGLSYGLYSDIVYADHPEACQFQFILASDYEIYAAKCDLVDVINEIKEAGMAIDTSAAEALVANENATLEEVQNMILALKDEMANMASRHNPADVTAKYITNPQPNQGNPDGWTVLNASGGAATIGSSSDNIGEFWNNGGYSIHYTIKNLPKGIYRLNVEGWTRTDMVSVLTFGDQSANLPTIGASDVNQRAQGRSWIDSGKEPKLVTDLFLDNPEDQDVEISITADNTIGDHWTCWGFFKLIFYGSADDDYKILADLYTAGWEEKIEGKYYYAPYVDALQSVLDKKEAATTKDEIYAVFDEVKAAYDELMKSVELYDQLFSYVDPESPNFMDARGDNKYHYDDVFIEVFERVEDMWYDEDTSLNNEEMEALIAEFLQKADDAINNTPPEPGEDVSHKLVNSKFIDAQDNSSFDGWTVASRQNESGGGNPFQNNSGKRFVVEQWNGGGDGAIIDVYQKVKLWAGAYRLTCKGWYRSTTNQSQHDSDPKLNTVNTFLYGSSSQYRFHDIYEAGYTEEWWNEGPANFSIDGQTPNNFSGNVDGLLYPNNCAGANYLFANTNNYDMVAEFISTGDSIKVGVKGQDIPKGGWLIWNDFVLTFIGNELEDMQPIAKQTADMYREYLEEHMAAATKAELQACIDNIDNAPDVATLLDAYKSIGDVVDKAINSMNLYLTLDAAIARLDEKIADKAETATKEAVEAAEALSDELAKAYDEGAINDEDIPATLERIEKAIKALNMPDVTGASDDNPIDMTDIITNPKYDNGSAATLNGWTNVDGKATAEYENSHYGVAEGWNSAFDLYQDLTDMPEGTYHVMLQGLYRQEGTGTDTKIWQYGYAEKKGVLDILSEEAKTDVPEYDARAKMYANGDSVAFKPWILIGTEDWDEEAQEYFANGYDGTWTEIHDSISNVGVDEIYYFPNNRLAFYDRAEGGFYNNELYCYVGSDGNLRIGACNLTGKANDWVPFTNWRLEYLGTESKHESTTGIRETEQVGKIEAIYSIDGRRMNALQKGMNIVVVNGKAKKIMVK